MNIKRRIFGLGIEEFWFDPEGYDNSSAHIVLLRTNLQTSRFDCIIPEKTIHIPLEKDISAIFTALSPRAKNSINNIAKTGVITLASSQKDKDIFYKEYFSFARRKNLLCPNQREETDLDIFLVRSIQGELLHAAAFIPFPRAGIYRYRYSVTMQKSQANAACLWHALLHAKNNGFSIFDLGGIPHNSGKSSSLHGIYFFKSQFGGTTVDTYLCMRGKNPILKLLLTLCGKILADEKVFAFTTALITRMAKNLTSLS
jgi:lipid II:glycine glycyltransferase (peptidoglycan interpeptide bridge formation enzyme)